MTQENVSDNSVNENLTPEQKKIAVKTAMAAHLDAFFCEADTAMESVQYYEEPDVFRFKLKSGYAILISASQRGTNHFLVETFHKLEEVYEECVHKEWLYGPTHFFGVVKEKP
jgi:hypothetical protein